MKYFIDIDYESLNKKDEELCGDKVEMAKTEDGIIIVLADGLGSGVKANILATITTKIAVTMLKKGADINETVDTIVNTLPVCSVRKIAYSTFTILKVYNNGRIYMAEYDNPEAFILNSGKEIHVDKKEIIINGKAIKESNFMLPEESILTVVSDGVIHAGIENVLNLGWQRENVCRYLKGKTLKLKSAKHIADDLIEVCKKLYSGEPGDDTTALVVKLRKMETIDLFTGPPANRENDKTAVGKFIGGSGKKIVCGGTAANIVARELKKNLTVNIETMSPSIPPTANIEGIDLVTEGVLTLCKAIDILKNYSDYHLWNINAKDGASMLAEMLVEDCTNFNLWVGKAINPAHQNPNLPFNLSIKLNLVNELVNIMTKMGKEVSINYI